MKVFTVLNDPTRLRIFEMLVENNGMAVSDISKPFDMSTPAISQHLKIMRDAKIVTVEKLAQKRIYHPSPEVFTDLKNWLSSFDKNTLTTPVENTQSKSEGSKPTEAQSNETSALMSFMKNRAVNE